MLPEDNLHSTCILMRHGLELDFRFPNQTRINYQEKMKIHREKWPKVESLGLCWAVWTWFRLYNNLEIVHSIRLPGELSATLRGQQLNNALVGGSGSIRLHSLFGIIQLYQLDDPLPLNGLKQVIKCCWMTSCNMTSWIKLCVGCRWSRKVSQLKLCGLGTRLACKS